jgi:hypothetical protein
VRIWILAWIVILSMIAPALSTVDDDFMEARGYYDPLWFTEFQDVELLGDLAFTFGVGGMSVFDIVDPDNPIFLGRYIPPDQPWKRFYRGAVDEDAVYAGGRSFLISVIDYSDPYNPTLIHNIGDTSLSYEGLDIEGDLLVAARHGDGLELIDVSDLEFPVTLSELTTLSDSWDLEIRGELAYVADGVGGLRIVDISDPYAPFIVATIPCSGSAKDVDVEENLAVVTCGSAGVDVFDISDPLNVQSLGHGNTSALAITVDIDDDKAYVADWDDIEVLDLSIPESPGLIAWERTPVRAMGLAARDGRVYVADWGQFRVYDFGPTITQDILVSVDAMVIADFTPGVAMDTSFVIANTGGAPLEVTEVKSFNNRFDIQEPIAFTVQPGEEHSVQIVYHPTGTDDSTFFKVSSDDSDEDIVIFPIYAGQESFDMNIGDVALDWTHFDLDGTSYTLSDYIGKVVVLVFFADW